MAIEKQLVFVLDKEEIKRILSNKKKKQEHSWVFKGKEELSKPKKIR